jgi:hypothetical protein
MLAETRAPRPRLSYVLRMAKGKNGGVLAAVVVAALLIAGNPGSGEGGASDATSDGSSGSRSSTDSSTDSQAEGSAEGDPAAPLYGPVPGQQDKDQATSAELVADPVPDECVLNAAEAQALIGEQVDRTRMTSLPGADGKPDPGCVAERGESQLVLTNVYEVRAGTPADAVRGRSGARPLGGVGEAAGIVMARVGPTLYVAGQRYLVTIAVAFREPGDEAWRAAGRAALDRLE